MSKLLTYMFLVFAPICSAQQITKGLFSPLKYQLNPQNSIETYPFVDLILPNIQFNHSWDADTNKIVNTSSCQLLVPSVFINKVSRSGIGGILPAVEFTDLMLTFNFKHRRIYKLSTVCIGAQAILSYSPKLGSHDFSSIDYPIAFQQSYSWLAGYAISIHGIFDKQLNEKFTVKTRSGYHYLPGSESFWAVDHSSKLEKKVSPKFSWMIGIKYVRGNYPYGTIGRAYPLADLKWYIDKSKK